MRRAASSLLLALPAALLALGWFGVSLREESARREHERRLLASEAHVVAAAAAEGLEELRAREDERPYYLYSYYYTPQDVISITESVAVSPLGRVPGDARVRGHFQIDPGAVVTSPLAHDEAPRASRARGAEIIALTRAALTPALLERMKTPAPPPEAGPSELEASNQVQSQRSYSWGVLSDIRGAREGKKDAADRAMNRKIAPPRPRVDVGDDPDGKPGADRGPAGDPKVEGLAREPRGAGPAAEYTPMSFHRDGERLLLYRRVTTGGQTSVQGALLDAGVLRGAWLQSVAGRHAARGTQVSFIDQGELARCAASAPLPVPLDDLAVCAHAPAQGSRAALYWQLLALSGVLGLVGVSARARARALRRAEELAGIERAFVASVSHELRTPLTTFRLHAEMLQEGWVSEERRPRVLAQLVEQAQKLARLIEDVLTFGRLEGGSAQLACRDGDLSAHVLGIASRERPSLEAAGVALDLSGVSPGVGASFDPSAVDQMLTNLLGNAQKYATSPAGARVSVAVEAARGQALVRVADNGPGVARAERARIFDRFYRGRDAQSSHTAGTGLGLSIVRGLARAMGGDARVVDSASGFSLEVALPGPRGEPALGQFKLKLRKEGSLTKQNRWS